MPNYRTGAGPGLDNKDIETTFGIKCGFGPLIIKDGREVLKWNRCWFDVPEEWVCAITKLINDIKAKYVVETIDMDEDDPSIQVRIDQIKCKFGSLRFYFSSINKKIDDDIENMIAECEKQLVIDDTTYGVPY